jgi:YD repeat-containing protein
MMTYDGYGRLKTQHRPEQTTGTATVYNYYADDRIQQIVDARGATINYSYDNRGLTTQVSTTSPNTTTIPVTPTVTYTYDNLGNVTQMTDGLGNVTYEYNQLSQLTAETRQFNDSLPNAPLSNNRFKLEYGYSLSGQLKFYKDAYGQQINYSHDKIGRLNSITGSSYGNVSNYATNPQYRAWGALKHLEHGDNNAQMNMSFDNRLRVTNYEVLKEIPNSSNIVQKQQYQYLADGGVSFSQNDANRTFDRSYKYDFAGRITEAKAGTAANGIPQYGTPYNQQYAYDQFGQMTQRTATNWTTDFSWGATYVNNRANNTGYDAEGNATNYDEENYQFNVIGRMEKSSNGTQETIMKFDGNAMQAKRSTRKRGVMGNWLSWKHEYLIRSSVLGGQIISQANASGSKSTTYVYAGKQLLAKQNNSTNGQSVDWKHEDPMGRTIKYSNVSGVGITDELDVNGVQMRFYDDTTENSGANGGEYVDDSLMARHPLDIDAINRGGCTLDGVSVACSLVGKMLGNGSGREVKDLIISARISANGTTLQGGTGLFSLRSVTSNAGSSFSVSFGIQPIVFFSDGTAYHLLDLMQAYNGGAGVADWQKAATLVSSNGIENDILPNPIKHPDRPIEKPRDYTKHNIFDEVRRYFDRNKKCEKVFNDILEQLSKDTGIKPEGDIRYYIDQLEKTGRTEVDYLGIEKNGSYIISGGAIWGVAYRNPGWGIEINYQAEVTGSSVQRANMNTFLGELVHAIGKRGPLTTDSKFSDVAVAKAMENLGWAESVEKAALRPEYANSVGSFDGKPTYDRVAGAIWHRITS